MFEKLFEKSVIGRMETKNRIVLPPMVRNYATDKGEITERILNHYETIAKGGVGTIIVEASFIHPTGRGFFNQIGIHKDNLITGLHALSKCIKRHEVKAGIQIHHAGRQTLKKVTNKDVVAPSAVKCPLHEDVPRELTIDEIAILSDAYADAARRAKEADFDFVEIHGGHGYLITQFLSPLTNLRKDSYGGDFQGRMRFVREVVEKIRDKVGYDFPVTIRLSGDEFFKGGYNIKYAKRVVLELEKSIDAFHISGEIAASFPEGRQIAPMAVPPCPLVNLAKSVKDVTIKPVIAVGKIYRPEIVEDILINNMADFVATGRWLLADPEWPNKVKAGKLDEINYCITCNQGCIDRLFQQKDVWCMVNPWAGREGELTIQKTEAPKRVMVVGGGPAGMQAAWIAKERGHKVILYEKEEQLGGQFVLASIPPKRKDLAVFKKYQINRLKKTGVEIVLGKEITVDNIKEHNPDLVIIAAGSEPFIPDIEIKRGIQVVDARIVLKGEVDIHDTVVVAGGGMVGCEVAEFLAEMGKRVKIVEQLSEIASDCGVNDRHLLLKRLWELNIEIHANSRVKEITEKGVRVETGNGDEEITGRTVVICMGSRPDVSLISALNDIGIPLRTAGDCREALKGLEAILDGTKVGCMV
jgi:2,4-dienoyl-CoA reductase-like NADH-dependent reductase (Old Yellow Enzyme family)/thioredoxin reductase